MLLHSGLSLSILIMLTNASRGKSDDRPWEEQEVSAFFFFGFFFFGGLGCLGFSQRGPWCGRDVTHDTRPEHTNAAIMVINNVFLIT